MRKKVSLISFILLLAIIISVNSGVIGQNTSSEKSEKNDMKNWELVWADEFNNPQIDATKWNFVESGGGFGNNELQYYTARPENVYIENGALILRALQENYNGSPYTSAKLFTQNKGDWTYGRFDIRAKLPFGQGIWPAIWMMPTDYNLYGAWPSCGEIDIMELLGHQPETVYGTLHYGMPWTHTGAPYTLPEGKRFCDDFHLFTLEWAPGVMKWYVDGYLYQTQKDWFCKDPKEAEKFTYPAPFDRNFYLQLNLAVGGNWPGYPDQTTIFPQTMAVDYVRVYKFRGTYPPAGDPPGEVNPPAPLRDPLPDGNYIYNGGFDQDVPGVDGISGVPGSSYWQFLTGFGGAATASNEDGVLKATINNIGQQQYAIQLVQAPLYVKRGESYKVTFDARSTTTRNIMTKVSEVGGNWLPYSGELNFTIGSAMKTYSYTFDMMGASDAAARIEFNLGLNPNPVYIDNVRVERLDKANPNGPRPVLGTGNYIYNGKFDEGKNRTAFWNLKLDNHIQARISVGTEPQERECLVNILTPGKKPEAVQLVQGPLNLENTEIYMVKFDARATKNRAITVNVGQALSGGLSYSGTQIFDVTKDMATYSFEFTMNAPTDIKAELQFQLGGNPHEVIIDNVSMIKKRKPISVSGFTRIEAEDYFDMLGIQTESCSEGSSNVGWMDAGDWFNYIVDVKQSGDYVLMFRTASQVDTGSLTITSSDNTLTVPSASMVVPNSGGWQKWQTQNINLHLNQGIQTLTVSGGGFNLNWLKISPNKLVNGGFDNGTSNWGSWFANWEGAYHTMTVENGQLKANIAYEGNEFWATQIFQNNLAIENGKNYRVSFDASSTVARKIQVMVEKNGGDSAKYSGMQTINLTPDLKTYSFEFTMAAPTDSVAHLLFALGKIDGNVGAPHIVTIDNVSVAEIDEIVDLPETIKIIEGNQIKNSTVDNGVTDWGYYNEWGGGASSTFAAENGELKIAIQSEGNDFWHVQVTQPNLQLVKDQTYILQFDARSTVARDIQALLEFNGDPYTKYFGPQNISLTPSMTTYRFEFTMKFATDPVAHIVFALGKIGGVAVGAPHEVYLDNISLTLKK